MIGSLRRWLAVGMAIFALMVLAGLFVGWCQFLVGGVDVAWILWQPDKAEVTLLEEVDFPTSLEAIPTTAGPVTLPAATKRELAARLLSRKTYKIDEWEKACHPIWGAKIRFVRDHELVEIYFCFSCQQLIFVNNGQIRRLQDFDPTAASFASLIATCFPGNEEWQQLEQQLQQQLESQGPQ